MAKPDSHDGDTAFALTGKVGARQCLFVLKEGSNRIGRGSDNDVVIAASGVSGRHAVIEIEEDDLEVKDLASKNGTFLDGLRVASGKVALGSLVQFGPVTFRAERVRLEDTWLSITAPRQRSSATGASRKTSTFVWSGEINPAIARQWLRLLDEVSNELASGETGALGRALAALSRGLGAAGAALVWLPAEGSPIVLGSYGDLPGDLPVASIAELEQKASAQEKETVSRVREGSEQWILTAGPRAPNLVLRGQLDTEGLAKPLLRIVHRMLSQTAAKPAERALQEKENSISLRFPEGHLPGKSSSMASLYREIGAVAKSNLPLLLVGETGVGKECLAETVHLSSGREDSPFLPINCAAIPADLLEAELFGIAKGVATGVIERPGRFTLAEGGTLFLDEIGDMSAALQAKLLRALEESVVQPVGGAPEKIDVRLIAATNTDLGSKVETGEFRRDLYYRLAGLVVTIPPLRQRQEDVAALIEFFFHQSRAESGREISGLTYGAMRRLTEARWPGNVRELRHAVRRLVFMCPEGRAIDSGMVKGLEGGPLSSSGDHGGKKIDFSAWERLDLGEASRGLVEEAMRRTKGNQTAAAALLGITRSSLRRRLLKLASKDRGSGAE